MKKFDGDITGFSEHFYVSKSALFKFYLPEIFYDLEKILYIDGDTLILKDLAELFNTDIRNCYAAVVSDMEAVVSGHWNEKVNTENYFNSGMMVLNLEAMRKNKITEKLLEYKRNETDHNFMDQNALNACFKNNVFFLDMRFNFLCTLLNIYSKEQIENYFDIKYEINDIAIYHFTGFQKVWENFTHKDFALYAQYLDYKEFIILCSKYFAEKAVQVKELQDKNNMLERQIDDLKSKSDMLVNSKPWRAYKKMRGILNKLRMWRRGG